LAMEGGGKVLRETDSSNGDASQLKSRGGRARTRRKLKDLPKNPGGGRKKNGTREGEGSGNCQRDKDKRYPQKLEEGKMTEPGRPKRTHRRRGYPFPLGRHERTSRGKKKFLQRGGGGVGRGRCGGKKHRKGGWARWRGNAEEDWPVTPVGEKGKHQEVPTEKERE